MKIDPKKLDPGTDRKLKDRLAAFMARGLE